MLGMTLLLAAFSGILGFGILGVSCSMPVALTAHAALIVLVVAFWIKKAGSLAAWYCQRVEGIYAVHPFIVTVIGFIFGLGGVAIMFFGKPSTGSNPMDREAIVYFGTILLLLGSGVSTVSSADWIGVKQRHWSGDG